ncbi:MAG: ABC transporter substrate-binding protein [Candidatus Binatia bacterium]
MKKHNERRKTMRRKIVFSLLITVLLTAAPLAEAQQPAKMFRIGVLTGSSLSSQSARNEAFRQGLRELGYVEGKDILIEWRSYEGNRERQSKLVDELVRFKVDVLVAVGSGDIQIAKEATSTIPIVMMVGGDPVASGFIASLARPGGNITGLATLRPELSGKRLELLKEIVPKLSRVAFVASPGNRDYANEKKEVELAAAAFGIKLRVLDVKTPNDVETAFQTASKEKADAVLFRVAGPLEAAQRPQIAAFAVKYRLPTMHASAQHVEAGGLMSYGVSTIDLARRAATYVDKILKGRKPADLPVEQPMKFEFIVNLKAAKQIGLTIPPNVLVRADRVIR